MGFLPSPGVVISFYCNTENKLFLPIVKMQDCESEGAIPKPNGVGGGGGRGSIIRNGMKCSPLSMLLHLPSD